MADQSTPSTAIPIKVVVVDQTGAFVTSTAVTIADNGNAVEGATTGAAIVTDANGTIHDYLRGLVKLIGTTGIAFSAPQHVIADASSAVIGHVITDATSVTNTGLGLAEDSLSVSGDTGVQVLTVRQDADGYPTTNTDGDYQPLVTDARGFLKILAKNPTTDQLLAQVVMELKRHSLSLQIMTNQQIRDDDIDLASA